MGDIPHADDPTARVRLSRHLGGSLLGFLDNVVQDRLGVPVFRGRQQPDEIRAKRRHDRVIVVEQALAIARLR
jgi:hypothetical protein